MYRLLLITVAAVVFALPGAYSVATSAAAAQRSPAEASQAVPGVDARSTVWPAVAPSPSPSPQGQPPVTAVSGIDDRWHRTTVTLYLTVTDSGSGVAYTTYRVGNGPWEKGTTIEVEAPRDHSNDGAQTVRFYSVGTDGSVEPEQQVIVRIDTAPPAFTWSGVSPSITESVTPVQFSFVVKDVCGEVDIAWRASDQYGAFAAGRKGLQREVGSRSVEVVPRYKSGEAFMPGLYDVELILTDLAGNTTTTGARAFRNYRAAPAKVWRHVSGAGKRVALTFDDGGAGPWASILTTLKKYNAHATFFPLGPYVAASPSLARRTLAEGNAMGSHGWTHADMTRQSYAQVRSELIRSEAPWWNAAGCTPVPYCRPPYGAYNGTTVSAAGSAGFTRVILWDVDPTDWSEPGSGVIAQRVLSHVHSGAIVVMHLRGQTAAALPAILSGLKARGYKAVSLPELFRAAGYR
jgi:peptidoglycan/xylan/chitin deacetylase (PgdA/CDA1 family)